MLFRSRDELRGIHAQLAAEEKPWYSIGFHANYAVVRLLKAFLVKNEDYTEADSIVRLFQECLWFDPSLQKFNQDIVYLSDFDERLCYPFPGDSVDEERILMAVAASERVSSAISLRLGLSETD